MATEKILNTRIQLKYDSLQNWATANTPLKSGEVAVAYLPPKGTGEAPAAVSEAVLMKVGPGNFNDLPFVSALAADVYAWAKEASLTINKNGTGNVVSGIEWDATANGGKGGIKFTTASVATSEGFETLQAEVDAVEKDIADNRVAWAKDDNTTYTFAKSADGKGITITPSEGNASTVTFAFLTQAEIEALNYLVAADITTGSANGTIAVEGTDVAVKGLGSAAFTEAAAYATAAQGTKADNAAVKTEVNAALALKADKSVVDAMYTNSKIDELLAAKQNTIPENTYDAYGAAATAEANAKAHTNAMVEQYLTGEGAADTIDTLAEIAAWINNEDAGATKIIADVATNTANISTLSGDLDKVVNGTTPVAKATDADTVDGKHASDFATSNQGANADTAYGWGDHAQEGYLKAADIEDKVDKIPGATEDQIVLATQDGGIKESGHTLADFATAEQGAKADSAIQSVGFEGLDGTPVLKVDEDTTTLNGANGVSVKINDTFDTINIELDTTTKNKIDNAVQTVIFAEGADLSNDYEARSRWGINVDNNTIVAFGSSDTISAGGEFDESADSHYVAKFNVKDHSISAHHTKACADYTGEDAEVWVFNCGSATEII